MNRKFKALCSIILSISICIAVCGTVGIGKDDVTIATMKNHYAAKIETTTGNALGDIIGDVVGGIGSDSSGDIGDMLGGVDTSGLGDTIGGFGDSLGGIGDAFGGVGDAFGGIAGGIGDAFGGIFGGGLGGSGSGTTVNTTVPVNTTSADIGLIIPVPAATQAPSEVATTAPSVSETLATGETVDYAAESNPYTKPTATFVAGDEDETIKWLQWIFIYTGFGLNDNGITGVLDEDTVAVVKKLQHENKLTVDGNITEDVIKAAEVLYYQSIIGGDASAIEVSSDATTVENVSNQAVDTGKGNGIPVALLIIVLVIIWVLAIGGIVLLFIFKKKKINAAKNATAEKAESKAADTDKKEADGKKDVAEKTETDGKTEIKSLSDLFEEAERKDK